MEGKNGQVSFSLRKLKQIAGSDLLNDFPKGNQELSVNLEWILVAQSPFLYFLFFSHISSLKEKQRKEFPPHTASELRSIFLLTKDPNEQSRR